MRWAPNCLRLAALASPLVSCFGAADYHCSGDDDCRWGERAGTCEPTQYCSYPDPQCPSGAKYSDQAGALAGQCVDAPVADESGSSTAVASTSGAIDASSGAASSSGGGSSTFAPQPVCGNEVPEDGEQCDDGNEIDGDGCNVDCVESGTPRWDPEARVHSGDVEKDALFWDVDVRPDDTFVAVGYEEVVDQDTLLVLFDGEGEVVWARQHDSAAGTDVANGVTTAVGSEIYVAGQSPNPTLGEGWIAVVEPADGDIESQVFTGRPFATGIAHMHPSRFVVAGYGGGIVGARAFSDMLVQEWVAESMQAGSMSAAAADGVRDIAYASGNRDGRARVVQLAPGAAEPVVEIFAGEDGSGTQTLAFGDGGLVLGGYVGLGMRDGWVQRLDAAGAPQWSWSSAELGEDEVEDVAIAANGDVVAVGFATSFAQDARVWKLSAAGELLWTWTWAEPIANDDVARGVAIRPDGDVLVVGGRTDDDGATDAWVVRLTP